MNWNHVVMAGWTGRLTGACKMKATTEFTQRYNKMMAEILAESQPDWLQYRRSEAYDLFQRLGLPGQRDDEWKYTSLSGLARQEFVADAPGAAVAVPGGLDTFDCPYAHKLVFINGRFDSSLSIMREPQPGVTVMPLAEAAAFNRPAALEFMGRLDGGNDSLSAFNTALWRDGLYLELERGARLTRPLIVHNISTSAQLVPIRHLLVLGEQAEATVIEHYQSAQSGTHFTSAVTECLLGRQASLTHIKLQDENEQAFHTARIAARQASGSRWLGLSLAAGGMLTRNDIDSRLKEEGAACKLGGMAIGLGRRHVDHHVLVEHVAPRCTSRQHFRSVLTGRARAVFNGHVKVGKGAMQTDAEQLSRNLLLSPDAEADSRPQLEIYADDVKCSHGSATGGLDESQLFYLRTRGIPEMQARGMLVEAFAGEVLDMLEDAALRLSLAAWTADKLCDLDRSS
jgi:Fe-S cluster assembly protein SufD